MLAARNANYSPLCRFAVSSRRQTIVLVVAAIGNVDRGHNHASPSFYFFHSGTHALPKRRLQADRLFVLPQKVGEGFVGNFLKALAGIASDGPNCLKGLVVELNALSGHDNYGRSPSHSPRQLIAN
jgi:hypothetical protein